MNITFRSTPSSFWLCVLSLLLAVSLAGCAEEELQTSDTGDTPATGDASPTPSEDTSATGDASPTPSEDTSATGDTSPTPSEDTSATGDTSTTPSEDTSTAPPEDTSDAGDCGSEPIDGGGCKPCQNGETCIEGVCDYASECGALTSAGKCAGDVLIYCEEGVILNQNCASIGMVCGQGGLGSTMVCIEPPSCTPDCSGLSCGPDPVCGEECGPCEVGDACNAGVCASPCLDCGDMVRIPVSGESSTFAMGRPESDTWGDPDEQPAHAVTLSVYEIDRYEVTAAEYLICVNTGACYAAGVEVEMFGQITSHTYRAPGKENFPINGVTWFDAVNYCAWLGKRLPTEAEWELAARGIDYQRFPWGNECPASWDSTCSGPEWIAPTSAPKANCSENNCYDGFDILAPVGSFPAGVSPLGIHDMAGNAWEWTADWYDPTYYESSPSLDPAGPSSGSHRVGRGGDYYYYSPVTEMRTSHRKEFLPSYRDSRFSFRCVRSL